MRRVLTGVTWAAVLWLLLSYTGRVFPPGDALAVLRPEVAVLALLGGLSGWRRARRSAAVGGLVGAVALAPVLWGLRAVAGDGDLVLYQKNVWVGNADVRAVLADIRATDPDIVVMQEFGRPFDAAKAALEVDYPTQVRCRSGVVILTRLPAGPLDPVCPADPGLGMVAVQVVVADAPVWIVGLHLRWPWPLDQAAQVAAIVPQIAALNGPVVVAGDFNMVPWGHSVRAIGAAAGAHRIGQVRRTYDFDGLVWPRIAIDHVLVPDGWTGSTEVRPLAGSDHFGLLARIAP